MARHEQRGIMAPLAEPGQPCTRIDGSRAHGRGAITRHVSAGECLVGAGMFHQRTHFVILMMVPWPAPEAISNSSISRLVPGNPKPSPLPVE
jgi:hypothetical protein